MESFVDGGTVFVVVVGVFTSFNVLLIFTPLSFPLGIAKFANKINANIEMAKVQVVLSRKLLVFCTPPIEEPPPPPKVEDNPPPLGFCTITININAIAMIKINIKKTV